MLKISIIIPIYNVETYVEECLISVARQTYTGCIECLLVDDCGTDGSMNVVEKFIENYDGTINFRIIRHKNNRGLSAARNTGIKMAEGDYMYFLDSDDSITEYCIENLVALANRYPNVDMVQAGAVANKCKSYFDLTNRSLPEYINDKSQIASLIYNTEDIPRTAWNKLLRREFVIDNKLYFLEGYINEDIHYFFILGKCLNSMALLCQNTYNYRTERTNSITNCECDRAAKGMLLIYDECIKMLTFDYLSWQINFIFRGIQVYYVFVQNKSNSRHAKHLFDTLIRRSKLPKNMWLFLYQCFPKKIRRTRIVYNLYRNYFFYEACIL